MMKILSSDLMASIPKTSIKKFVKKYFDANITDDGAEEIVKMLEEKAKKISRYAVSNAKKESREKVTRADVMKYIINGYDE